MLTVPKPVPVRVISLLTTGLPLEGVIAVTERPVVVVKEAVSVAVFELTVTIMSLVAVLAGVVQTICVLVRVLIGQSLPPAYCN